ncbi:hypothetical protein QUA56_23725 [Microcoleus sp. N3A4]|uniref:hypothetical protein n=1 Tax=Microcoleus sp. N3A4 TaxID=3055379 RepID=UPI002FD0CC98
MTFFNRQLTKKSPAPVPVEDIKQAQHEEPLGYQHGIFRHWMWLSPSNQRAQ